MQIAISILVFCLLYSCSAKQEISEKKGLLTQTEETAPPNSDTNAKPPTIVHTLQVIERYPHDTMAFTQGLCFVGNDLYETTGQYGASSLRKIDMKTGKVLKTVSLETSIFGEGLAFLDNRFFILTWVNQFALVMDKNTLHEKKRIPYSGEGWGLTTDGTVLYMSNGTEVITVRSAEDFSTLRTIVVRLDGTPVRYLNELEWVEGELYANVWQSNSIMCINPENGMVTRVLDASNILGQTERTVRTDVLNGIAYNSNTKELYITGKYWPFLFKVH
ncbi:MAG: glutaminyl-peptide cyclotransferase [Chlorobi bacterium]|nr:MAG: glutaminyl-peptide cyclotransferase [Bacteroidota bacterium]KXK34589.1 MAG: Glutamine cyclotransferase [Chlorobi bacterium OLB6]MBE2265711.1 glutaminyl-peptide cyclotransferase [Flavobacteriales bacterium]MBL1160892.1 glutaminyl-peptide cyclotransferase [Chlorobiota bacterium]MBW7852853.1 glutaminyl-peptide cyclotransferase [Candidatus Kapabacteria bacterium]MCC6330916.1 glutaminyl-peptide cyclotransferase [Ignavibacteria bacterium]